MKRIVAVTACPTGIAHTYMAASRLENEAKKLGYDVKVEKQGAKGIEDRLTAADIAAADVVIFAVETKVMEEDRFAGRHVYRCPVAAPIKNPTEVIESALAAAATAPPPVPSQGGSGGAVNGGSSGGGGGAGGGGSLKTHILTGVSYMIPLVIAASVIMGIARIGAMLYGVTDIWEAQYEGQGMLGVLHTLDGLGGLALSLMLPVFAGFISYSMAGRQGLAAGLSAGLLARDLETGFFGALAAGLFAGWLTSLLVRNVNFKGALASLGTVFLIPVGSVLGSLLFVNYVLGVPFAWLNHFLVTTLNSLEGGSALVMALVVGAMVGFDLGGPVNKAAVVTAMGMLESGVYGPNTAAQVAIIVPTLGYGVATLMRGHDFSTSFKECGNASLIMGLVGVSEGAIPFTLADAKRLVPFNMLGCAIASATAVGLGAVNTIPISGIYGWLLVERWPVYVLGIAVGTAIVATGALMNHRVFQQESTGSLI